MALLITDEGQMNLDFEDQIVQDTVVAHNGDVPQARMRELLELEPLAKPEADADEQAS